MPGTYFDNGINSLQQKWNEFINLLKKELDELYEEQKRIYLSIMRIEKIKRIANHNQNAEFLLLHKKSLIDLHSSFSQKFDILEAFKELNNLDNPKAIEVFNEIIESDIIKKTFEEYDVLKEQKYDILDEIDKVNGLIRGNLFDVDTLTKYCQKHNIDDKTFGELKMYLLFKVARSKPLEKAKIVEIPPQVVVEEISDNNVNQNEDNRLEITQEEIDEKFLEPNNVGNIEIYREKYEVLKNRYEDLKITNRVLLNKYYSILKTMNKIEIDTYKGYMNSSEPGLKVFLGDKYDETMAKVMTINVFDDQMEIENLLQRIPFDNYSQKDDIDFLEEWIEEYELHLQKLEEYDFNYSDEPVNMEKVEESKVFFLLDENNNPFIDDEVLKEKTSIINLSSRVQTALIQNKRGYVKELLPDDEFKKLCGRTVYIAKNSRIIISYVKVNSGKEVNDGVIMILTVLPSKVPDIKNDVRRIMVRNGFNYMSQLAKIEGKDEKQLEIQSGVRSRVLGIQPGDESLGDSNLGNR